MQSVSSMPSLSGPINIQVLYFNFLNLLFLKQRIIYRGSGIYTRGGKMPISTAPYKRSYKHTKSRGREKTVKCDACGRTVPRYKTFVKFQGMRIRDPAILRQMDRRMLHLMRKKLRLCPACARFRKVSQPGKSVRKKYGGREKTLGRRRKV